eukprot:1791498-Amphidinium_carterae.1
MLTEKSVELVFRGYNFFSEIVLYVGDTLDHLLRDALPRTVPQWLVKSARTFSGWYQLLAAPFARSSVDNACDSCQCTEQSKCEGELVSSN